MPLELRNNTYDFFFGTKPDDRVTDVILGLERNWDGPIETNGGIEMTLLRWQQLEKLIPIYKRIGAGRCCFFALITILIPRGESYTNRVGAGSQ